ncbi:MAG: hypothetical protein LBL63_04315, partial [Clostridiales Family XIII bacterium]|nr:hypothetical protein [Clostridiales Family XIII bacterium]
GIGMGEGKRFTAVYVEAESRDTYRGGRLTRPGGVTAEFRGRAYVIDETEYVRISYIAGG